MRDVKTLSYAFSQYRSHARAAISYRKIIEQRYELRNVQGSDVVILHMDPIQIKKAYETHPELRKKYVIAYCVWEASSVPERFQAGIRQVQEVWTPTEYCKTAFNAIHQQVFVIPHVVERDMACSEDVISRMSKIISLKKNHCYFLTITKTHDRRKNLTGLVDVFAALSQKIDATLIVKTWGSKDGKFGKTTGNVLLIDGHLQDDEINALYELTNAYVSAHFAEGWGLTLSDALLFGKPVIATKYSGNMDFMSDDNSLLVQANESFIRPEDCYYLFDRRMKWGYPSNEHLEHQITRAYHAIAAGSDNEGKEKRICSIAKFDATTIGKLIFQRLDALGVTTIDSLR